MSGTLSGTKPYGKEELSTNHGFPDQYAKQWMSTLNWMRRALREQAAIRNDQRRSDSEWLEENRVILRRITGLQLSISEVSRIEIDPFDIKKATYTLPMANGILYSGILLLPDGPIIRGLVVFADPSLDWTDPQVDTAAYLEQGFAVIQPFLAKGTYSFKQHEQRKWYAHPDHELLHNFAFICGGSLAGMEAAELHVTTNALLSALNRDTAGIPIIADLRGRHFLSGALASAVYPDWASVIRLDEHADSLNYQESDVVSNTIWGFHQHMDLLTLLQLADGAHMLFINQSSTVSDYAAKAAVWFGEEHSGNPIRQVMRCRSDDSCHAIRELLEADNCTTGENLNFHVEQSIRDRFDPSELYRRALSSKAGFLEAEQMAASNRKNHRYDLNGLSITDYKKRVAEAILSVMGPPLPRSDNLNVRTRKRDISANTLFDLFECVLESVKGIDVVGYLFIPKQSGSFPVVICQHGLLGRPDDLAGMNEDYRYSRMAWTLADKGYVVFVPFMNWGWGGDPARDALAKHAYALGITPNRFEAAQLNAIVDFLESRPEVIADRIGFYGLSYGGHASLWLGACEPRLAAVVTAGHFNDWHKKLVSTEFYPPFTTPYSYITVNNCIDMFTFDVLNKVGHAELAAFYAPRPYMVENGLLDPVTPKPWVDAEFGKVRSVYDKMHSLNLAELSHFNGPHRFWGEESLIFLRKHLQCD